MILLRKNWTLSLLVSFITESCVEPVKKFWLIERFAYFSTNILVQDVFWTSYVRSIYVLCPRGCVAKFKN